ncbi:hypothetical protein DAD99_02855 [Pseudarthrobacter sp. AB1]|nr:hypothetical protein [Pseudarthrobacter sp. AB1]
MTYNRGAATPKIVAPLPAIVAASAATAHSRTTPVSGVGRPAMRRPERGSPRMRCRPGPGWRGRSQSPRNLWPGRNPLTQG